MKLDFIFRSAAQLRRGLFWLHLAAALAAGIVILILSATGALLAYQRQITAWADRMPRVAAPAGACRLPLERLVAAAGDEASAVVLRSAPDAPVVVSAGRKPPVFLDPYTGQVVGRGSEGVRSFFQSVTEWHRWLAAKGDARETGRAVTGAANLAFLFIVASGVYLWWPRRWGRPALKAITVPNTRLAGRARDFNWHNAIGFWSAIPLLIVIPCGAVISYQWATDLVYRVFGEDPPKRAERAAREAKPAKATSFDGADALLARAETQQPGWKTITLRLPVPAEGPVAFTIDRGEGVRPDLRATLTLDCKTAAVVRWEPYESQTPARRARLWMRWAHTGEAAGLIGQTIAGLASAGSVVLVCTGLILAWRRWRAWRAVRAALSPLPSSLHPSTQEACLDDRS